MKAICIIRPVLVTPSVGQSGLVSTSAADRKHVNTGHAVLTRSRPRRGALKVKQNTQELVGGVTQRLANLPPTQRADKMSPLNTGTRAPLNTINCTYFFKGPISKKIYTVSSTLHSLLLRGSQFQTAKFTQNKKLKFREEYSSEMFKA